MNKQELIKKFEEIGIHGLNMFGTVVEGIPTETAITLIKQLDEPEKVKVPQCVHKYIQEAKEYNWDLQDLMKSIDGEDSEELQRWFYHECNQETLARAWLLGYEVEKESKYIVKLKNVPYLFGILNFSKRSKQWYFSDSNTNHTHATNHTRKELEEAGFGWVFDCPGIEIEEVEV
ncbi:MULTISPECIES: DUF1642 domain-containing protein [Streptococcus]|uniref:DUF1642 domain-containing protein n=1 Tax=Streptococcus TaxID=1301 RepID=UPI00110C3A8A|nr:MULTISPECIES: DUF1642 domain-containing protein [Streptococcus]MDS2686891.1 DUF1642 domain-containing protein [Streptococcus pneumoniae]TMR55196.1 DUF1642 domain-containing protein [Streptococcus pseudopneumoniae]